MADETVFKKDIVIPDKDGKVYWVPEKVWRQREVPKELQGEVDFLLDKGVVFAAMPSEPGIGLVCYLVNLRSIITMPEE